MAQYLTYAEYTAWGGTMTQAEFSLAEVKARARIDALTQNRIAAMATIPEQVKAAMMEVINVDTVYSASAQISHPVAASYTTDGYSESYGSADSRTASVEKRLASELETLLGGLVDDNGTPLLYAGVPTAHDPWPGVFIP